MNISTVQQKFCKIAELWMGVKSTILCKILLAEVRVSSRDLCRLFSCRELIIIVYIVIQDEPLNFDNDGSMWR